MSLVKNSLWNLFGYIVPTLCAIPSLGYLARSLGVEQFGIYTLLLAVVGYASFLDGGISRAAVKEISVNKDNTPILNSIITNSIFIVSVFSVLGSVFMFLFSRHITNLLGVSDDLKDDVSHLICVSSIILPIFLVNQVLYSILEGLEKFKKLNFIKTINSSMIALLPALFVFLKSGDIKFAVYGLLSARVFAVVVSFVFCFTRERMTFGKVEFGFIIQLIRFGGWLTVSNIINPVMNYFDRFIISSLLGAKHVGFYTAPSEAVSKFSILPNALVRAFFPRFAASTKLERRYQTKIAYKLLLLTLIPSALFVFVFSENIMTLWMGKEFGIGSSNILKILIIGYFFNSLALVPYTAIQAAGYANITAYLSFIEVLPYLFFLYICITTFGLQGAAFVWSIRMLVNFIALNVLKKVFVD